MSHDILISHASKDKALADHFVDIILNIGCNLTSERILCTSLEGMGIPSGTSSFIDFLKEQVKDSKLVILLLTENYFDSVFCICELGAIWGLELKLFPITISPISKSNMPGTLKVSQAGDILDAAHLDELKDVIAELFDSKTKTARWTVKRDAFIRTAKKIIQELPEVESIKKSELDNANSNYAEALDELEDYSSQVSELKKQIKDLEGSRNAEDVKQIRKKYTNEHEEFKQLCENANIAISNLEWATRKCLFWYLRDEYWIPDQEDWDNAKTAEANEEITNDEDVKGCSLNTDHPRVAKAIDELSELGDFISEYTDLKDPSIIDALTEEHSIPITLRNKKFWSKFLVYV